ncbi:helix-turn-helix transcriptional regulator [Nocardia sp. NPDC052316]|uniref:helix-turn-helix transcriptional regulator n=1 Tax=Nocardia sp. NPDC052316 TaxID=3364329 RepID=UPI0037C71239
MVLILDTEQLDPGDREDAVATFIQEVSAPSYMTPTPSDGRIGARFDAWTFGPVDLVRNRASGFRLTRTAKQIRIAPASLLALTLQEVSTCLLEHVGHQWRTTPGKLFMMHIDSPYQLDWGGGGATSMFIPLDRLNLSVDRIHAAVTWPQHSPLQPMIAQQIAQMAATADALATDPAAGQLGHACTEMARALVISASGGSTDGAMLPREILLARIRDYVQRELFNPDLSPEQIARAHHISERYLYKLCAQTGFSLEQHIITQRLERARDELARPDTRHRTIAAIARECGFKDPSHFTRRFRDTYGISPSRWRQSVQ